MAWADGKIQQIELQLLKDFLKKHINLINDKVGAEVITYKEANDFLIKFLKNRPDPKLLTLLREMTVSCRLNTSDEKENEKQKLTILKFCMDIAASAVEKYPYGIRERFNAKEKDTFIEIIKTLKISPNQTLDF